MKTWYFFKDGVFYPIHGVITEFLSDIDISSVGYSRTQRYLFSKDFDLETVSIGQPFNRDFNDKSTPPYSLLIVGSFYKCNNKIYYEGGFSIC